MTRALFFAHDHIALTCTAIILTATAATAVFAAGWVWLVEQTNAALTGLEDET